MGGIDQPELDAVDGYAVLAKLLRQPFDQTTEHYRSAMVDLYISDHARDILLTMIIALGLLLIAQAVPPPIAQRSADCAHPVYASDQLVCTDPELRAIDA